MDCFKSFTKVLNRIISKMDKKLYCLLLLLLSAALLVISNTYDAYSAEDAGGVLSAVSPVRQQMKLEVIQPQAVMPGGCGYMTPQTVVVKDTAGKPLAGVPVTFEVSTSSLVTAVMPGFNSKIYTVNTDSSGIASAANTSSGYVGKGYQVYSKIYGVTDNLTVTASIQGGNKITFNVEVGAVGSTLVDTTDPVITYSAKDDTGADYVPGTWSNHSVTVTYSATDSLSGIKSCSQPQVFSDEGANQSSTGTAVDGANRSASVTFGPINIDKSAPVTTVSATKPVYNSWNNGTVTLQFNGSDSISGVGSIYYKVGDGSPVKTDGSNASVDVSTEGTTDVRYWAVDIAGNVEESKTISVKVDKTSPTVTCTQSPVKNENGWNNSDVTLSLAANDVFSGVKELHYKIGATGTEQVVNGDSAAINVSDEGITTVTYWAVDNIGAVSNAETTAVKIDKTIPVITTPKDVTLEATAVNTPVNIGTATVKDVAEVELTNDAPAGGFPVGANIVTWTARDSVGNVSSAAQTITVTDTTKPVLTVQGDIVVEATAVKTPITMTGATATDIFNVTITNDGPLEFPVGTTPVIWTAKDINGNSVTATQNVTVVDSTKPVLTIPANITKEATGDRTIVDIGTATATDIFNVTITTNAPADFPVGKTDVGWIATDENGNVSTGTQTVIVQDTIKPELTIPADITIEATSRRMVLDIGSATATDIFDVTVANNAPADFTVGTTPVKWRAVDENNNVTEKIQNIIVTDTTKPVLELPADITVEATGITTPVQIGTPKITEIFDTTVTNNAPSAFPIGNTSVTWTVKDSNGNVSTGIQTIRVVDTTKPLLSLPNDITKEATAIRTPVSIGQATATDIFKVTVISDAPSDYPIGTTKVTWTATDANGNVTSGVQNITIKDTTKPVLTVPRDIKAEATAIRTPVDIGTATATDIFTVTVTNDAPADFPIGTTPVTWTAKDANGNVSTAVQNITIVDTTLPLLSIPLDVTVEATAIRTPVTIGEATATDIFDVTITKDAPTDYPVGITKVTWTATDANGNVAKQVQNVTVTDTTKPELTVPVNITLEATAVRTPVDIGDATATDIFDVTIINNAPLDYPLGKTVVTWTATDANGNSTTGTQTITVVDTTAPVLSVPADKTVEATAVKTAVYLENATATDIFNVTIINDAPATYSIGTTDVTWTATDENGNASTGVQKITIVDTTAPVLKAPADKTVEATAVRTPVDIGEATATDIFNVVITNDAPLDYPIGTTNVTWTATDENGNVSTAVQKITIVDTTDPELIIPADITVEATAVTTPVDIGEATATDIFQVFLSNDAPGIMHTTDTSSVKPYFPIGTTNVTWTATDLNGNSVSKIQRITVVDTTAPVLTIPEDMIVEATAVKTPVDIGDATATDIFNVTIKSDAPLDYSIGITEVTWTATDENGNVSKAVQKVKIVDTTLPVVKVPADLVEEAKAIRTPVIIGDATATDIFNVIIKNDAPLDYPIGTTDVTWTATDENGNVSTAVQKVTIIDTTAPVLKAPADMTVEATAVMTSVYLEDATATDIFKVNIINNAPATYPIGTTEVTWTATDANGNVSTAVQKVTIIDTTAPVLSVPADMTVEATAVRTPVDIGIATATDIFDVVIKNDAPLDYPIGTTTVTWTATDANGNVSTAAQKITIKDTTAPVLTVPADVSVEATAVMTAVYLDNATATDIFTVNIINNAPATYPIGTTEVTWTATDENGNVSTAVQKVKIVDTTAPVLTIPADMSVEATAIRTPIAGPITIGDATATDIFKVTIKNNAPLDYPLGRTEVTWTATDENGNVSTAVQYITIVDTTAPVLKVPADQTVEATAVRTPVDIGLATATDIFNVTITNNAPLDYPIGTTEVNWTATDESGNVSKAVQKVTIVDTTAPVLSIPADKTVEATAVKTPVDIGLATATDIFDVTIANDAPLNYPIGTTNVTWTATDANGNVSRAAQKITIVDTTAPVLTVPVSDMTLEATAVRTPVTIGDATATDIFDVTVINDAPLDYPIGKTDVTWIATDANGNVSREKRTITIVDTTAPVLSIPADQTVEATAVRTPVTIGDATATDIFDVTVTNNAPLDYPIGTTEVTWTAIDANGNVSKAVQRVTVVDTTAPVLNVPADQAVEATAVRTPVTIGQATATDIFDVTVTNNAPLDYPIGTTDVTWTATDANGNVSKAVQKVTVADTTAPVLSVPASQTVEATAVRTPVTIGQATATDIFDVTITNDAPTDFPVANTPVTWTATDANGNVSTAVQNIIVVDTTAPVLSVPADITAPATGTRTVVSIGQATATDIFDVTITNDAPADFPIGTTAVTWTATDANGNVTTKVQNITIQNVNQLVRLTAYNQTRDAATNSITPRFMLENVSDTSINLSTIKMRYYYTIDGAKQESFWCDYAQVSGVNKLCNITPYVQGTFHSYSSTTVNYNYLEIGFPSSAGILRPGDKVVIQGRFAKADWSNYNQTNDYSFNPTATDYTDTQKITVYQWGTLISGTKP